MGPSHIAKIPNLRKLNIGVVGIGRMGQRHAMNILFYTPRATLLCVCSPAESDLIWAEKYLRDYGVEIYSTFEEMIETPNLDAVVIASATSLHVHHSLASLKRGIHVLCEKPVTLNLEEVLNFAPLSMHLSVSSSPRLSADNIIKHSYKSLSSIASRTPKPK